MTADTPPDVLPASGTAGPANLPALAAGASAAEGATADNPDAAATDVAGVVGPPLVISRRQYFKALAANRKAADPLTSTSNLETIAAQSSGVFAASFSQINTYRASHGAVALLWDDSVASSATTWVNTCTWRGQANLTVGENLWYTADRNTSSVTLKNKLVAAVNAWYSQVATYPFNNPPTTAAAAAATNAPDFSQLVWRSSVRVGCAIKVCQSGLLNNTGYTGGTIVSCR